MSEKNLRNFRNQILIILIVGLVTVAGSTIVLSQINSVKSEDNKIQIKLITTDMKSKINYIDYNNDREYLFLELQEIKRDIKELLKK
ncbi:MAG: hypothetical protein HN704_14610 [Bacteroidetes bacterium]|jgi:hypothetical protein|nr:hypothetical protein [Bacteroidota bacterium]MBT7492829.1 hypothetical protein [Bacteroidota bacterium]